MSGKQITRAASEHSCRQGNLTEWADPTFAYVGKQVPCAAARLDHFLAKQGVRHDERVTVISAGAGEFTKAVDGSRFSRGRILDWFHIAMKFRAAEMSVLGSRLTKGPDWSRIESELKRANWLVWYGKGRKAVPRLKSIGDERRSGQNRINLLCGGMCEK